MYSRSPLAATALLAVLTSVGFGELLDDLHVDIQEDAEIQAQLLRTSEALLAWAGEPKNSDEAGAFLIEIEKLKQLGEPRVVAQLAFALGHADEKRGYPLMVVLEYLHLPPGAIVEGLAPHLFVNDRQVGRWITKLLNRIGGNSTFNCDIFTAYLQGIRKQGDFPVNVVSYMYLRNASSALDVLLSVSSPREPAADTAAIVFADHVIQDGIWKHGKSFNEMAIAAAAESSPKAQEQLAYLLKDKRWWVRMYVAAVLRNQKFLRTPELVDKLMHDENEAVKEFAIKTKLAG